MGSYARFDNAFESGCAGHSTAFEIMQTEQREARMCGGAPPTPMNPFTIGFNVGAPPGHDWSEVGHLVLSHPITSFCEQELRPAVFVLKLVVVKQGYAPATEVTVIQKEHQSQHRLSHLPDSNARESV